jgi:hypothetical protein
LLFREGKATNVAYRFHFTPYKVIVLIDLPFRVKGQISMFGIYFWHTLPYSIAFLKSKRQMSDFPSACRLP